MAGREFERGVIIQNRYITACGESLDLFYILQRCIVLSVKVRIVQRASICIMHVQILFFVNISSRHSFLSLFSSFFSSKRNVRRYEEEDLSLLPAVGVTSSYGCSTLASLSYFMSTAKILFPLL